MHASFAFVNVAGIALEINQLLPTPSALNGISANNAPITHSSCLAGFVSLLDGLLDPGQTNTDLVPFAFSNKSSVGANKPIDKDQTAGGGKIKPPGDSTPVWGDSGSLPAGVASLLLAVPVSSGTVPNLNDVVSANAGHCTNGEAGLPQPASPKLASTSAQLIRFVSGRPNAPLAFAMNLVPKKSANASSNPIQNPKNLQTPKTPFETFSTAAKEEDLGSTDTAEAGFNGPPSSCPTAQELVPSAPAPSYAQQKEDFVAGESPAAERTTTNEAKNRIRYLQWSPAEEIFNAVETRKQSFREEAETTGTGEQGALRLANRTTQAMMARPPLGGSSRQDEDREIADAELSPQSAESADAGHCAQEGIPKLSGASPHASTGAEAEQRSAVGTPSEASFHQSGGQEPGDDDGQPDGNTGQSARKVESVQAWIGNSSEPTATGIFAVQLPSELAHTHDRGAEGPPSEATTSQSALASQTESTPRAQVNREISLKLVSPDATKVDVQFRERAGNVQVTVRTADSELAKSMQTELGSLVNRLENRGFKAEAFVPAVTHGTTPTAKAGQSEGGHSQKDNSGSSEQKQQRQEQNNSNPRRQSRRQFQAIFSAQEPQKELPQKELQ